MSNSKFNSSMKATKKNDMQIEDLSNSNGNFHQSFKRGNTKKWNIDQPEELKIGKKNFQ
jgi:hypothetical protein